jgi:hypothetical protein
MGFFEHITPRRQWTRFFDKAYQRANRVMVVYYEGNPYYPLSHWDKPNYINRGVWRALEL